MKAIAYLPILLAAVLAIGCRPAGDSSEADVAETQVPEAAPSVTPAQGWPDASTITATPLATGPADEQTSLAETVVANYGYTHQRPDGNRLVSGRGALPAADVVDVELSGRPVWIAAAAVPPGAEYAGDGSSAWAVILDDGRVQAFIVQGRQVTETTIEPVERTVVPPLLKVTADGLSLLLPPEPVYGPAPPAIVDNGGGLAVVSPEGIVTITGADGTALYTAESRPLPDGRLLVDELGRLIFLSHPTTRYQHGIAGDEIEAAGVTLIDPGQEGGTETVIMIPEPSVVEGIMPLWADLNDDGQREIIVTQSDASQGAQIVAYDEAGRQVAAGPAIGRGNRWRHQLAVGPFGPQGQTELVDVLTPHIGGVVEFYRLSGAELQIMAKVPGYTSHVIGSRNLDMALAGDLDGDGRFELLLPSQGRDRLGAIRRTDEGAEVAWSVQLDGIVSSNLAAAHMPDGSLVVGVGREDGVLRMWLPGK